MSKLSFSPDMFTPGLTKVFNEDGEHIGDYAESETCVTGTSVKGINLTMKSKEQVLGWLEREHDKKTKRAPRQEKSQITLYELL